MRTESDYRELTENDGNLLATDEVRYCALDWALWFTRKEVTTPYHLTVTTDY
jgi:hypothetical protein